MPKVRFLETRTVKAVNGETFQKGKVYDLPESSVEHWDKRGVVERLDKEAAFAPQPPVPVHTKHDLDSMTVKELEELAVSENVDLKGAKVKEDIIKQIRSGERKANK